MWTTRRSAGVRGQVIVMATPRKELSPEPTGRKLARDLCFFLCLLQSCTCLYGPPGRGRETIRVGCVLVVSDETPRSRSPHSARSEALSSRRQSDVVKPPPPSGKQASTFMCGVACLTLWSTLTP